MSIDLDRVEGFAELFHHYYSALAPDFGGLPEEKPEWESLTFNERRRLVAATRLALMEVSARSDEDHSRPVSRQGTEGRECGC